MPGLICKSSPVGGLGLDALDGAITQLHWGRPGNLTEGALFEQAKEELTAYFAGDLRGFTLPLRPRGSAFQKAFYAALCAIPYGETRTYGDLAKELSVSAQAIGQACGGNPIAILIPCHRVLGATGLGGSPARAG